jgi:hypothetical protein
MKPLVLFLFLAGLASVRGGDLLKNGDFADGIANWYGDARAADGASSSDLSSLPSLAPASNGITVKLRNRDWTRVYQDFQVDPGTYKLHVAFSLSPSLQFSDQFADYVGLPAKLEFPDKHPIDAESGQWLVVVSDSDAADSLTWTVSPSHPTGSQSYTFTIKGIDFDHKQTLTLFFPPGDGVVTLQHVTLVPADSP